MQPKWAYLAQWAIDDENWTSSHCTEDQNGQSEIAQWLFYY